MITKRQYYATVDGGEQEYIVNLKEEKHNQFTIDIDGRTHEVDFAMAGDSVYSIIIDGKSYAMEINEKGDNFDILMDDGDAFDVEILDEMKRLMKMRHSAGLEGRQVVEAQMPGYIWKILVEKGQEVKAGEPLMILVAMKMENEIKAPKDGVVEELFIELDQTITTGDRLAVVE
jgi:acetyl/propionyl-CoA carboxylase alpha subunit